MLQILANRTYRHLFLAQVIALIGTGLATVALGLLAYDLAGPEAGAVLGTALAIKMIAYVGVAPIAAAFAERLPRRAMLVGLDAGSPVSPQYKPPFRYAGSLHRVTVDLSGEPVVDHAAEMRAFMRKQ